MRKLIVILLLSSSLITPMYAQESSAETNNTMEIKKNEVTETNNGFNTSKKKVSPNSFTTVITGGVHDKNVSAPSEVVEPVNTLAAGAVNLFLKTIVGIIIFFTVTDMVALAISPLRGIMGAEETGSDKSGKRRITLVTSDFRAAVALEGGTSKGGMGGESTGSNTKQVWFEYGKLRSKTAVIAIVVSAVILSPQFYDLIIVVADFALNAINKIVSSVR